MAGFSHVPGPAASLSDADSTAVLPEDITLSYPLSITSGPTRAAERNKKPGRSGAPAGLDSRRPAARRQ